MVSEPEASQLKEGDLRSLGIEQGNLELVREGSSRSFSKVKMGALCSLQGLVMMGLWTTDTPSEKEGMGKASLT